MKKKTVALFSILLFLMTIFSSCSNKPVEFTSEKTNRQEMPDEPTSNDTSSKKERYAVVFYDYDGKTILFESEVEEGESAKLPSNPQKDGCEFLGWEGDYSNVTESRKIRAVYSDEKNVFLLLAENNGQNQIKVKLQLCGVVKTCGFDLTVFYNDDVLELLSCDDQLDLDIVSNQLEKHILVNYSSANDQVKKKDIIELTFQIKNPDAEYTKIHIEMTSIKEINGQFVDDCDYTIINNILKIK